MSLAEAAARAATLVRSQGAMTRWFLACDNDADGLCAAAVAALALRRAGARFSIRASRDKTASAYRALAEEECDAYVILDKGTSHLDVLAEIALATHRPVLVVDHHNVVGPTPAGVTLINPRAEGMDGSRDASAATTAVAFALALCGEPALAWAPVGLAGAVGDWQHMGGWQGWNKELVERSRAAGFLVPMPLPRLVGVDLAEALSRFVPAIPGLHQDVAACRGWLESIAVDADAEAEELDAESRTRLVSGIALRFLAADMAPPPPERLVSPVDFDPKRKASVRHVFRIVDACGREGEAATGVAFLMGDESARAAALACFARYRAALADGVGALRREGATTRRAFQFGWTQRPDYTGMVAGLGMTHGVKDRSRPLAILSKREDGRVQVSTRGTNEQVALGLDLGRAVSSAARLVSSEGGGHPVAAGTVIAADQIEAFLDALDAALVAQRFLEQKAEART
jgi:single-stranded-DNA-specific exonuclease